MFSGITWSKMRLLVTQRVRLRWSRLAEAAAPAAGAVLQVGGLTGDATKGAVVFNQCKSCHAIEAGVNRVGPSLHGVVGR